MILPSNQDSFLWRVRKVLRLFQHTDAIPLIRFFLARTGGVWLPVKAQPGLKLYCRRGTSDIRVFYGALARHECDFQLPEEPTCIVDAGANIGVTTALFASRYPQAQIFAVEPDQENIKSLRMNCAPFKNVEICEAALWPKKTTVQLEDDTVPFWARSVTEGGTGPGLPTVTMSDLVARSKSGRVSVLKMDIEGAEEKVFSSDDLSWLPSVDCLLIEVHSDEARRVVSEKMQDRFPVTAELGEKLIFAKEGFVPPA